ncbi:DUF1461 domain-containing protein [Candidatus Woesearchaeota archaeon]|nr:DUF1461 domain-containing protein [Candidatus Woesearchaeota archaeon]
MNKRLINFLTVFLVVFILVLGIPSFLSLNPFIYFNEAKKTNIVFDDFEYLYENVHGFLLLRNSLSDNFTIDENNHMQDVRLLINTLKIFSFIFIMVLASTLFLINKIKGTKKRKTELTNFFNNLKKGGFISLSFLIFLTIIVFINFSFSFDAFHRIFFPQGNWLFSADSLLITLFPQTFFLNMAKKIFITNTLFISLLILIIHLLENQNKY